MEKTENYQLPYITGSDLVSDAPAGFKQTAEGIDAILKTLSDRIGEITLGSIYPVGSIYMSAVLADPAKIFGGTWERWGQGRVPIGVDETDTALTPGEKTGGDQNPLTKHSHGLLGGTDRFFINSTNQSQGITTSGSASIKVVITNPTTQNTGDNTNHKNWQPYVTCYMWKRTA